MMSLVARYKGWRRNRLLGRVLYDALYPPPPEAFGAFGRSLIVPPARVALPSSIFIGDDVVIHEGIWLSVVKDVPEITPKLVIGDRVRIGRFCQISCTGEVVIEDDVLISDQVLIGDTYHAYEDPVLPATKQLMAPPNPVRIGRGSLLGFGVVVLPGTTIGEGAYVAEGSVVRVDVPSHAVVAGNPARIVESVGRRARSGADVR